MAYTQINVQKPGVGGTDLTDSNGVAGGAGTGYFFSNDGHTFLSIFNSGAGTPNVVVEASNTIKGYAISGDQTIALAANGSTGDRKIAGPFDKSIFDTDNTVQINFTGSNETDVRIAAFQA